MSQPLQEYRNALRGQLNCGGRVRKSLLKQFDQMAGMLLSDNPVPSQEELNDAFGSPQELAAQLLLEVPAATLHHNAYSHWLSWVAAILLVTLLAGYSLWMTFDATVPVEVTEKTVIYSEVIK